MFSPRLPVLAPVQVFDVLLLDLFCLLLPRCDVSGFDPVPLSLLLRPAADCCVVPEVFPSFCGWFSALSSSSSFFFFGYVAIPVEEIS